MLSARLGCWIDVCGLSVGFFAGSLCVFDVVLDVYWFWRGLDFAVNSVGNLCCLC